MLFYPLFAAGLVAFAILLARPAPSWGKTLAMAGLIGFFAYATYDLTNSATLEQGPLGLSLLDISKGICVSAAAAPAARP